MCVDRLWDCADRMNATCGSQGSDMLTMQNTLQRIQTQLSTMAKHVSKDATAKEPGGLVMDSSMSENILVESPPESVCRVKRI